MKDIELEKQKLRAELRRSVESDGTVFTRFLDERGPFSYEEEEALQGVVDEEAMRS